MHLYHLVDGLEVHECDAALHERDAPPEGNDGQGTVIVEARSSDERGTPEEALHVAEDGVQILVRAVKVVPEAAAA